MKLNCDLGESYGSWSMGLDDAVMPYIDQANIACGYHAGDPLTMLNTIQLAHSHGVEIGAHPSYPDLVGFGRRSMRCSSEELRAMLYYQIAALDGMCHTLGASLSYVKPHGAMYNDMMADEALRATIMQTIGEYHRPLKLMLLSTANAEQHKQQAQNFDVEILLEGFADRRYTEDGFLQPRSVKGSVLDRVNTLSQAQKIVEAQTVLTSSGAELQLNIDSLCVHGDNPDAIESTAAIRKLLGQG
ncbi:MAG: 5-oxoprolinase subunit PxpA [Pseudomonadales bacterium]